MHAYLITGQTQEHRRNILQAKIRTLGVEPADIVTMETDTERIGIDVVRQFERRMILAPLRSKYLVGIITNAHRLTQEAQNALLKILEEPPVHVVFFVETATSEHLLPTVVSRLSHITEENHHATEILDTECKKTIEELLSASPGKKLAIIESIAADRISAREWIEKAIMTCRIMLLTNTSDVTIRQLVRKLLTAQGDIELNINPKLILDNVFLSK